MPESPLHEMVPTSPRILQTVAWVCFVLAALMLTTVVVGLAATWWLDVPPPDYNRAERVGDAAAWFYVGCLHLTLAHFRATEASHYRPGLSGYLNRLNDHPDRPKMPEARGRQDEPKPPPSHCESCPFLACPSCAFQSTNACSCPTGLGYKFHRHPCPRVGEIEETR